MDKKKTWILCLCILGTALFLGIGAFMWKKRAAQEPARIICIPKIIDSENDFWVQLLDGVRMAAEEYGMELTVMAPKRETDIEEQIRMIYEAIEQKPDAIILTPSSYERTAQAAEAVCDSGIPLILMDSDVDTERKISKVSTDNIKAGRIQGECARKFLDSDSGIVVVAHVKGSSTALEREKGLREGLGEFAGNIVETIYSDSDYEKGYEKMKELLEEREDITVVIGLNEYSAVGAARAIKALGLQERITMVGFDSSLEEIQLLEEGIFAGIVIQNPYKMGYLAVEAADHLIQGERVPLQIDSGSKLITREELFSEENQKLLFLFTEE